MRPRIMITITITIMIMILFFSCGNDSEWLGYREVRDGIEFIQNSSSGVWQNRRELVLTTEVIYGDSNRTAPGHLTGLTDVDVDQGGNVYVCDGTSSKVRVFNSQGKWLKNIELKQATGKPVPAASQLEISPEGTIFVLEKNSSRIFVYNSAGEFQHFFESEERQIYCLEAAQDNHLFISALILNLGEDDSLKNRQRMLVSRFNAAGTLINKLSPPYLIKNSKRLANPFSNVWLYQLQNGGLVEVLHYPFVLRIYEPDGKLKRVIIKRNMDTPKPDLVRVPGIPVEVYMLMNQRIQSQVFELPKNKLLVQLIDKGKTYVSDVKDCFRTQLLNVKISDEPRCTQIRYYYDLYDSKGRFLQTFRILNLPGAVLKFVDQDGKFYIRSGKKESDSFFIHRCAYQFIKKNDREKGA